MRKVKNKILGVRAFTLIELLIAMSLLAIIVMVTSSLFIDSYKNSKRFALQNSVYEDARFVMNQLADEIASNRIDYDEYYNQMVYLPTHPGALRTYGQNFGQYYSQFFHPGDDNLLGYDCNDGPPRNRTNCTVIRGTLDRQTGQHPYSGKPLVADDPDLYNAFCGNNCGAVMSQTVNELYLISADAKEKTIIARERIGGAFANPAKPALWALSRVKMKGTDENSDSIVDTFTCADGYSCGQTPQCSSTDNLPNNLSVPRKTDDLNPTDIQFSENCDAAANGFIHDFVPISPMRIDVTHLSFQISPVEDPQYAFSEASTQRQPQVTISLTVQPNPELVADTQSFAPFTITRTVATQSGGQIPSPVKVQ